MKRSLFTFAAVLCICSILQAIVSRAETKDFEHVSFSYSLTPQDAEWAELSVAERRNACNLSSDIYLGMNTAELLQAILDYPFAVDIFAYNSPSEGIQRVERFFPALKNLLKRSDASRVLTAYLDSHSDEDAADNTFHVLLAETLLTEISHANEGVRSIHDDEIIDTVNGVNVYGTPIYSLEDYNDTFGANYTMAQLQAIDQQSLQTYSSATLWYSANPCYNCHSYAWYDQSNTSNHHWLGSPSPYLGTRYYSVSSNSKASGDRVYYSNAGHSAIIYYINGSNVFVLSKWGACGLFCHKLADCPYSTSGISYWRAQ